MADNIRAVGVFHHIIVRKTARSKYEILSGHNRVLASQLAGLTTIKAIVHDKLSDSDADQIVMITNIHQRSLADLSYTERALVLAKYHEVNARQGQRSIG